MNARKARSKSCPVCCNLFLAKSELADRRPLVACDSGDTICGECFNECRRYPDAKCPTCGDELRDSPTEHKSLLELISSYAGASEIPIEEMQVLRKPISRDGCISVYDARWRKQNVVIKVVKSDNEKQKTECRYATNLLVGLYHPNLIRFFGTTRMQKHFGVVIEKAACGSLDMWIGKIDGEKAAEIALGIVSGLEFVHSRKVVHRYIRPSTILMCGPEDDMIPKIGDFSTSKVVQSIADHTQIEDDLYNAPEIRLCSRYGFTADVFSLAITLFEIFNGQLFRDASTEVKRIIFAVKAGRVGKIPSSCQVPACLRSVIQRGWDQNPGDRPDLSEYSSALKTTVRKPTVQARDVKERHVSGVLQAEEMASVNVAVPAQAVNWSESCEILNSKQLRLKMIDDIKTKSTNSSLINDSVLSAMAVVPRHLFVEEKRLVHSSRQEMVTAAYVFNKPIPATMNSYESSPDFVATQLSMTEIIPGQSVLLVGIKGGYIQAVVAQLVGINGWVESATADDDALDTCRDRLDRCCPLSRNIDWIRVPSVMDSGSMAAELKRQEKIFHTVIFCFPVEKFPFQLTETGLLHDDANVSILAPVKDDSDIKVQLYLRCGNHAELRTITDFEGVFEEAF